MERWQAERIIDAFLDRTLGAIADPDPWRGVWKDWPALRKLAAAAIQYEQDADIVARDALVEAALAFATSEEAAR